MSRFDHLVGDVPEPRRPRRLWPARNTTPGALERWDASRRQSIRVAYQVARSHTDDTSPMREIVRRVQVPIRPVPRGGEVIEERLELECGHIVPLPGRAIPDREERRYRRCAPCAEANV